MAETTNAIYNESRGSQWPVIMQQNAKVLVSCDHIHAPLETICPRKETGGIVQLSQPKEMQLLN